MFENSTVKLVDLCAEVSYGYTASAKDEKVGPKFLRITDIQGGEVDWNNVPYCEVDEKNLAKNKLENGDIVVARTGNSTGENYLFESNEEAVFASYLIKFRIDPELANPYFVWLQMRTQAWWNYVAGSKSGSAQAGANAKVLGQFEFFLPVRNIQDKAAEIIFGINRKLALNRQTNQTLEHIAQTIFKSWFVDFEPTRAKIAAKQIAQARHDSERSAALREALLADDRWPEAVATAIAEGDPERAAMAAISGKSLDELDQLDVQGRTNAAGAGSAGAASPEQQTQLLTTAALFPDALVDSELGEIPEGWDNFKMVDLVKHLKPGTNYQPKRQVSGIPFVNGKHVQSGFLDFTKEVKYITQEEYERVHKKWRPEANDVLITRIGTLGRVGIVTEYDLPMALHYNSINIKEGVIKHPFIFFLLKSDYFQYFYHLYKKQAVQEFVTIEAVEGIQINLPKDFIVLDEITKVFENLFLKLKENHFEINTLIKIRDTLLPKLLSGELELTSKGLHEI